LAVGISRAAAAGAPDQGYFGPSARLQPQPMPPLRLRLRPLLRPQPMPPLRLRLRPLLRPRPRPPLRLRLRPLLRPPLRLRLRPLLRPPPRLRPRLRRTTHVTTAHMVATRALEASASRNVACRSMSAAARAASCARKAVVMTSWATPVATLLPLVRAQRRCLHYNRPRCRQPGRQ